MKAIVAYGAKDYRFCEVDTPKVGEGEILIKIEAAGICASDRAVYMGATRGEALSLREYPDTNLWEQSKKSAPGRRKKALSAETGLRRSA